MNQGGEQGVLPKRRWASWVQPPQVVSWFEEEQWARPDIPAKSLVSESRERTRWLFRKQDTRPIPMVGKR